MSRLSHCSLILSGTWPPVAVSSSGTLVLLPMSAGAFLLPHWFTLCMRLTRAPHVLCTQRHSWLSSGRSVPLVVHAAEAAIHSANHIWLGAKGASSIIQVPRSNTSQRVPSVAFIHRHTVCQGNGSHHSPMLLHIACEQPSLQGMRG